MKQKIKKLLSFLVISCLIVNSSYAYVLPSSSSSNTTVKTRKLEKLNTQLNDYINKELKKSIINVKNTDAKKSLNGELNLINEINKDLVTDLKYSNDKEFDSNISKLKSQARKFMQLRKDINDFKTNGVNNYIIDAGTKAAVEKNIVGMQSYYADILKTVVNELDLKNDIKETGDGKFEISSNYGKLTFTVAQFTNIYSLLTGSQQMDYDITIGFEIPKDEKLSIPFDIIGSMNFKLSMKKIDEDFYFTLNDYSFDFSKITDKSIQSALTTYKTMLDPYKGKTIHIPAQSMGSQGAKLDYAAQVKNIKSVLDILSKDSLLSPYKKEGEGYLLSPNRTTLDEIFSVYGGKFSDSDYMELRKGLNTYPLIYSETNGNPKISSSINDKGNQFNLTIEKKGVDYAIELSYKGTTSGQTGEFYAYIQKDLYKLNIISPEGKFVFSLQNKVFDLLFSMPKIEFTIKGSSDTNADDLKMELNSKEIGTIKSSKDDKGNYTYNFYLKITDFSEIYPDIPAELKNKFLEINISGKYLIEKGEFKIEKPASFIELDELTGGVYSSQIENARDSKRKTDLTNLASKIVLYYYDSGNLPNSLEDLKINMDDFKDPKDGQTINGCKFGYNYKIINKANNDYSISTCLEKADKDGKYIYIIKENFKK